MNVFVLTTWCPFPVVNGSTLRTYHLLQALASRHDVDLVTFSAPAAPDEAAVAHLRTMCRDVTVIPKSPFAPLRTAGAGLFSSTPRSLVATDDPDVRALVAARSASADVALGLQLSAARYLTGLGISVVFEDAEPRQIQALARHAATLPQHLRLRLTWWKHARYLRRLVASMSAVTVVSEQERDSLIGIGVDASRIHVVPNGAAVADLARPRAVASPPRLIYAGAVTYPPNLEAVTWFLAEVMPRVRTVRPDVEFWVTGDTGDVALDRFAALDHVRFTGRLPDVKDAISGSAVAVVPLLTGGGTRLKVLEALALGTPVVSTRKGAEGLAVADGEELLLADSPQAFADAVLRILGDASLAGRLSSAGRARISTTYTWDTIGREFLELVDAVGQSTERQ
jgi:polysaccharide biosynthesis protein PslH